MDIGHCGERFIFEHTMLTSNKLPMKTRYCILFFLVLAFLCGACRSPSPSISTPTENTVTPADIPILSSATPTPVDPQALLQRAIDHFIEADSFQMTSHQITAYRGITAEGIVNTVYGEFNTVSDVLGDPEVKVHVQSEFRYSPGSDFTGEEYYFYEQEGAVFRLSLDGEGQSSIEPIGDGSMEYLLGDAYQTVLQYGKQAQFMAQEADEVVYMLDHPAWYTLQSAIGFADLGFLAMQPTGDELVKDYVEQVYPTVQTVRFVLYVSIAEQVFTKVEMDNQDFMQSFWDAYDQALIDQGADSEQLTQYEILPDHGAEFIFSNYDQVPDFDLPN